MQTFLYILAFADASPGVLMLLAALSLGSLTIFLRHKLG